jgi:hypothetical protein
LLDLENGDESMGWVEFERPEGATIRAVFSPDSPIVIAKRPAKPAKADEPSPFAAIELDTELLGLLDWTPENTSQRPPRLWMREGETHVVYISDGSFSVTGPYEFSTIELRLFLRLTEASKPWSDESSMASGGQIVRKPMDIKHIHVEPDIRIENSPPVPDVNMPYLRKLAKNATVGPWTYMEAPGGAFILALGAERDKNMSLDELDDLAHVVDGDDSTAADLEFIAAANPKVVLALLDALERAK